MKQERNLTKQLVHFLVRNMKKTINILLATAIAVIIIGFTESCNSNVETSSSVQPTHKPLNISVYIDLSDRLIRDLSPIQAYRDTAIINHLIDYFIDDAKKNKIATSKSHFQVFLYPSPKSSNIGTLASGLNVDLSKTDIKNKKHVLKDMKNRFGENLSIIYTDVIEAKNWSGSDIWGFFSNKKVDEYCIREGYRNILVILTDGYLYEKSNKIKEGNAYSYVLPQTLDIPESALIVNRSGLENLEVLMLEVNPYDPKQHSRLTEILQNWFSGMGVSKFIVSETDLPVNIGHTIDAFLCN